MLGTSDVAAGVRRSLSVLRDAGLDVTVGAVITRLTADAALAQELS
ncbi:hypothetical protein [Rhodovulum sulfidophilum]|nr:hypothetical protein [Rhodovulum sulfidophilum]MCE8418478.1 hypothetical protein [Rhodovulum sulfidophilum]